MSIPTLNLNKLRQQDSPESSATEPSDETEVTEESSQDSSQEKKSDNKPSMSSSSAQAARNPLAAALASHRSTEKSSAPVLSPRSAPPSYAPPPLPPIPVSPLHSQATTTTASTTAISTKSSTSTNAQPSTASSTSSLSTVFKLPNPKVIMKPAELAKLLITTESMQYKKCLSGASLETLLRSNTKVMGSSKEGAKPVNINETYLAPFMNKYFEAPGVIKMLNSVVENYVKQSDQILSLYDTIGSGRNFARSDEAAKLMLPLIAPVIDFICGKDKSVESSGLPKPVLDLMLAVDEEVITWFNKNGIGKPEDLLTARSNALTSFFGTRSFMGTWTISLNSDKSRPDGFFRPLSSYLNTYLNVQVTNFTHKLMDATTEQRKVISKQAAIVDSRSAQVRNRNTEAGNTSTNKFSEPEKSEKKSGFPSLFGKEKTPELHSPRGKKETEILHSPRRQLQRGETLQENASRETTRTANRKKFVKEFIAAHNLKQKDFAKFLISFQNSVVEMSREEYKTCKEDPLAYCISYLMNYTSRLITRGENPQAEIDALWALKTILDDAKAVADDDK